MAVSKRGRVPSRAKYISEESITTSGVSFATPTLPRTSRSRSREATQIICTHVRHNETEDSSRRPSNRVFFRDNSCISFVYFGQGHNENIPSGTAQRKSETKECFVNISGAFAELKANKTVHFYGRRDETADADGRQNKVL